MNSNVRRPISEEYIKDVFSWNLRKSLRDKKLTQQQFANMLGTSQRQVSRWASGQYSPEWKTIADICNKLDCTPDYLMRDHYAS